MDSDSLKRIATTSPVETPPPKRQMTSSPVDIKHNLSHQSYSPSPSLGQGRATALRKFVRARNELLLTTKRLEQVLMNHEIQLEEAREKASDQASLTDTASIAAQERLIAQLVRAVRKDRMALDLAVIDRDNAICDLEERYESMDDSIGHSTGVAVAEPVCKDEHPLEERPFSSIQPRPNDAAAGVEYASSAAPTSISTDYQRPRDIHLDDAQSGHALKTSMPDITHFARSEELGSEPYIGDASVAELSPLPNSRDRMIDTREHKEDELQNGVHTLEADNDEQMTGNAGEEREQHEAGDAAKAEAMKRKELEDAVVCVEHGTNSRDAGAGAHEETNFLDAGAGADEEKYAEDAEAGHQKKKEKDLEHAEAVTENEDDVGNAEAVAEKEKHLEDAEAAVEKQSERDLKNAEAGAEKEKHLADDVAKDRVHRESMVDVEDPGQKHRNSDMVEHEGQQHKNGIEIDDDGEQLMDHDVDELDNSADTDRRKLEKGKGIETVSAMMPNTEEVVFGSGQYASTPGLKESDFTADVRDLVQKTQDFLRVVNATKHNALEVVQTLAQLCSDRPIVRNLKLNSRFRGRKQKLNIQDPSYTDADDRKNEKQIISDASVLVVCQMHIRGWTRSLCREDCGTGPSDRFAECVVYPGVRNGVCTNDALRQSKQELSCKWSSHYAFYSTHDTSLVDASKAHVFQSNQFRHIHLGSDIRLDSVEACYDAIAQLHEAARKVFTYCSLSLNSGSFDGSHDENGVAFESPMRYLAADSTATASQSEKTAITSSPSRSTRVRSGPCRNRLELTLEAGAAAGSMDVGGTSMALDATEIDYEPGFAWQDQTDG